MFFLFLHKTSVALSFPFLRFLNDRLRFALDAAARFLLSFRFRKDDDNGTFL